MATIPLNLLYGEIIEGSNIVEDLDSGHATRESWSCHEGIVLRRVRERKRESVMKGELRVSRLGKVNELVQ